MTERHLDIAKILHEFGNSKSTSTSIGEALDRKHDVINYAFKEMYEYYNVYWCANINPLTIKLYPYFFRIAINDQEKIQICC